MIFHLPESLWKNFKDRMVCKEVQAEYEKEVSYCKYSKILEGKHCNLHKHTGDCTYTTWFSQVIFSGWNVLSLLLNLMHAFCRNSEMHRKTHVRKSKSPECNSSVQENMTSLSIYFHFHHIYVYNALRFSCAYCFTSAFKKLNNESLPFFISWNTLINMSLNDCI